MNSPLKNVKVYTTYPHNCSYLPNKQATTLFLDPRQKIDTTLYTQLSLVGFRRSGYHIYRPHCSLCDACLPARILVKAFEATKSQARNIKNNNDIQVETCSDILDDESYKLYELYINARHANGDMYPPSEEQYKSFLSNSLHCTEYHKFRYRGELVAVSVIDILNDGISAVYTFFNPNMKKRGLGTYSILWQVKYSASLSLDYVYLGYWIKDCVKMSYKSLFKPLQVYINGSWSNLENAR